MIIRHCDICGKPVNEDKPKIIEIAQYVEDGQVAIGTNPTRKWDLCDLCSDSFVFGFDTTWNMKAMVDSIKLRKCRLEKQERMKAG